MSNEIEIAMRSSRLRYRRKYIYKGSRLFFFWGLILIFWHRLILFHMRVPFSIFHLGKRVRPLFFPVFSPPFALYIFPVVLFWQESTTIAFFFLLSPPFALYIFPVILFWEKSATITFFSFLLSLPSLYFFRLFILGKECNHYFFLFSPLHSASLCFTSFVFCGVNFRHFLTTLLTNNDKEPVKKAKKCFSRPFFLSSSKLFALYTNRTEKMS